MGGLVASVVGHETEVAASVRRSVAGSVAVGRTVVVGATGTCAVVDEVYVTEVAVVVAVAVRVVTVGRVARARSARLYVRVAIRADHERIMIPVVESVIAAFTCRRRIRQ